MSQYKIVLPPDSIVTWGYTAEQMHTYAAAVSADDNAALRAARIAYANEFPLNAEGEPDVGNIHANIRAMKERIKALEDALQMAMRWLDLGATKEEWESARAALGDKTP